jgi:hypothetical protein
VRLYLLVEGVSIARGKPASCRLDGASNVINQKRSGSDGRVAPADHGKVSLSLGRPMNDRTQQPWVRPTKASQRLCIGAVVLAIALSDQLHSAWVSHYHAIVHVLEQPANPWRVQTRLDDERAIQSRKPLAKDGFRRTELTFLDHLPGTVHEAVVAEAIRDVKTQRGGLIQSQLKPPYYKSRGAPYSKTLDGSCLLIPSR